MKIRIHRMMAAPIQPTGINQSPMQAGFLPRNAKWREARIQIFQKIKIYIWVNQRHRKRVP